jgi:hypothetical protein
MPASSTSLTEGQLSLTHKSLSRQDIPSVPAEQRQSDCLYFAQQQEHM